MSRRLFYPLRLPDWLLPVLLLVLGASLRLAYLGSVPAGLHQDESFTALNAWDLFHEQRDSAGLFMPVYMSDWGDGQSAMYTWLLTLLLFFTKGRMFSFLCRLPQAAIGILTLWVVYRLMTRMFNRTLGTISLFLLAICPWHIMMCRWGLDANLAPGFLIFSLYFFVRALENEKCLPLAALFYGLSLYCYAVIWIIVPILLVLQILYCLHYKKLHISRLSILSSLLLFLLALPLILFVLVNNDILPQISLPFMTIPKMVGYRGSEIASGISQLVQNFKTSLTLLARQNTGSPYDFLLPWGLFYDIGRVFIIIGFIALIKNIFVSFFIQKKFCYESLIFISLIGGGITCLLVTAHLHQINNLFIPLVLCEAYGIYAALRFISSRNWTAAGIAAGIIYGAYLLCLILFQRDYYTSYRKTADAYFAAGMEECVDYALEQCAARGISCVSAEKGAQWPRLLLFTRTLPSEYLPTVTYDVPPAPASFVKNGILIRTRIDYTAINTDTIYIIYYDQKELFEEDFILTQFYDWYVATPKDN